ncbi:hypothetical protein C9374_004780 [Naegleria lovaniensis]|uniref:Uncharacterized protein n=1 Tax=Naegleria lovaniensis TaxID=51637 RepID=A0AA88GRH6_NAELO|nr:uncharacterized protein C9374_004780 [Naegleria lovaniensis]KAG2382813.1 hypothetical protein C9374_004780 [Naegleria lovaniensis]
MSERKESMDQIQLTTCSTRSNQSREHFNTNTNKNSNEIGTTRNKKDEPSLNQFLFPHNNRKDQQALSRRHSDVVKPVSCSGHQDHNSCQMPIKRRLSNVLQATPAVVYTPNLATHSMQPWMDVINLFLSDQFINTPIEKACLPCTLPLTAFGNQIHQRICQFMLENEKTKQKMQTQMEEYQRQLSILKHDNEGCMKENTFMKKRVKQLEEEVKLLRFEIEKSKLEHRQQLSFCQQNINLKEDDIQTLCTYSEKLQIENELLSKVQQVMSKELASLVSELKAQKEQNTCLRNISEMLHSLVEEKDRVLNEQTEWLNSKLLEIQSKCSNASIFPTRTTSTSHLQELDHGTTDHSQFHALQNILSHLVEEFQKEFTSKSISAELNNIPSRIDTESSKYEQKLESLKEELKILDQQNEKSETSLQKSHEILLHDIDSKMGEISRLRNEFSEL